MNIKNENEYISQLNRIWHKNRGLSRFEYFTDIMFEWYMDFYKRIKDFPVVVLGTGIPLELVLSLGAHPLYLPGGSHETCAFSEHLVPRDTDPVSRSILGYLNSPDAPDLSESLFLVPLTSDSMRKAAYLLKEDGKKVLPVDIPPVRGDSTSLVKWERQMELLTTELEDHLGHGLRERELRRNTLLVSKARGFLYEFLKAASENEDLIPGSARMLVQNSFYCARDLTEWTASVKQLTMEILSRSAKRPSGHDARPRVLLMGSPVFFPGYKIPFLLEETGLCIFRNMDASTAHFQEPPRIGSHKDPEGLWKNPLRASVSRSCIRRYAPAWYENDASSAFTANDRLRTLAAGAARTGEVDGVVFHVLKGQVEPDFELAYFENYFAELDIPTFRLETDYQYQDIEQLRIRMEAFREMLVQRKLAAQIRGRSGLPA